MNLKRCENGKAVGKAYTNLVDVYQYHYCSRCHERGFLIYHGKFLIGTQRAVELKCLNCDTVSRFMVVEEEKQAQAAAVEPFVDGY